MFYIDADYENMACSSDWWVIVNEFVSIIKKCKCYAILNDNNGKEIDKDIFRYNKSDNKIYVFNTKSGDKILDGDDDFETIFNSLLEVEV